jgi:putative transposase
LSSPGHPHHVTERGNGRARDDDRKLYRDLLATHCRDAAVEVWA